MRRSSGQQTSSPAKPSHAGTRRADSGTMGPNTPSDPSGQGRAADGTITTIPINDVHGAIDTTALNYDGDACCHGSDDNGLRKGSPPTRPGTPWSFSRQHAGTGATSRIADQLMPILEEEEEEGVDSPPVSAIGKDPVDDKEG
ncbi:hypothetical protein BN1723_001683 [Verticillium longisporum]|uniref:Uncharacterized protein n=1 Tax=Verticillium longisporum TaxID=100787 RepID=A0A0G4KKX0_VERLO|nr:hypothetical protein HYQ44_006472 [Verticillium longisporum]CRK06128.1 hypothetical protein BN1723_001683 [Verticillium longisporum]CRK28171.1 hypothetical protein BN1708_004607 [Verticillium longisporum]